MTAAAPAGPTSSLTHRQITTIFAGLMIGMFLAALDQTIVSTAIRTIADDLHGLSLQAWATTGYLITATITTPLYGKLSDIFGRKPLFLSAITIGELRQGIETVRHRGDAAQATRLARWLGTVTTEYADAILPFDEEIAQIWGKLRVPHAENPLDKQIAATALLYGLTVVTRNVRHYEPTGVAVLNPFT
jgi:predicted nucleic acid-binding protein